MIPVAKIGIPAMSGKWKKTSFVSLCKFLSEKRIMEAMLIGQWLVTDKTHNMAS